MKSLSTLAGIALLIGASSAKKCHEIKVPVAISATNVAFSLAPPADNIEVIDFTLNITQPAGTFGPSIAKGPVNVTGSYSLATTYCEPDSGPGKVLQLLTHGVAFDRSYWDFPFDNHKYSYVDAALARGYSTFTWDRLGTGQSSHGEPVNEIQASLEIAALAELTRKLRAGAIPTVKTSYSKIVHVGHSFGSVQSYTLAQQHPELSAGLILTGFSQNATYVPFFALGGNFVLASTIPGFAVYPAGYLASGNPSALQSNFFAPGQFDPAVLQAAYLAGQPVTVGELLTVGGGTTSPSSFAGPVLVITGDRDIPFCGGNCHNTGDPSVPSIPSTSRRAFPNATTFEAVIVPGAGHGLNFEISYKTTYSTILDFLSKNVK